MASAAHSTQPQARQGQDAFEVSEQHLNFLSIFARLPVKADLGDVASYIARRFMDAARVILRIDVLGQQQDFSGHAAKSDWRDW